MRTASNQEGGIIERLKLRAATAPSRSGTIALLSTAALVLIDQLSKGLASAHTIANPKLMLGIDPGQMSITAIVLLSAVAAGAWALFIVGPKPLDRWSRSFLTLLAAGTIGNLLDRIVLGHVRDFLRVGPTIWNIADLYILVSIPLGIWIVSREHVHSSVTTSA